MAETSKGESVYSHPIEKEIFSGSKAKDITSKSTPYLSENLVYWCTIIGFTATFLIFIGLLTWYTSTTNKRILNDTRSENKITVLNQALQSALGPRWPLVLLVFTILLTVMFFLLYLSSDGISLELSDIAANRLNITITVLIGIFGILVILLGVKDYLEFKNKQNSGDIPDFEPNITAQQRIMQIVLITGGILIIIFGGYFIYSYIL